MSTFDGGYIQQTFVTSEKRKLKKRDIPMIENALKQAFNAWDEYSRGEKAPWKSCDGGMMNVGREYIIRLKALLEELEPKQYPEIYYRQTPYMVYKYSNYNMPEWERQAVERLEKYKADPNYQFLDDIQGKLTEKEKEDTGICRAFGRADLLAEAIAKWKEDPEEYVCLLRRCALYHEELKESADKVRAMGIH